MGGGGFIFYFYRVIFETKCPSQWPFRVGARWRGIKNSLVKFGKKNIKKKEHDETGKLSKETQ